MLRLLDGQFVLQLRKNITMMRRVLVRDLLWQDALKYAAYTAYKI